MFCANHLLLLVCCLGLSRALDEHLICKSMRQVFSPDDHSLRPNRGVSQGAPGKRGAPGLRGREGPKGARGPQGIVDYGMMYSTIDDKLQPVISSFCNMEKAMEEKMDNLVNQLTLKIENLTETLPKSILHRRARCDIQYKNSCFWAIAHATQDITNSVAESICNNFGARVADIHDDTLYHRLVPYLRKMIPSKTRYCFRLGLTYDYLGNVARRQNGAESITRWYPGGPSRSTSTTIAIWVHQDKTNSNQGLYNYRPSVTCRGIVCELQEV